MFKPSLKEMGKVFEENVEIGKKKWIEVMNKIYSHNDHAYMFLNVPSQDVYSVSNNECNKIVIENE